MYSSLCFWCKTWRLTVSKSSVLFIMIISYWLTCLCCSYILGASLFQTQRFVCFFLKRCAPLWGGPLRRRVSWTGGGLSRQRHSHRDTRGPARAKQVPPTPPRPSRWSPALRPRTSARASPPGCSSSPRRDSASLSKSQTRWVMGQGLLLVCLWGNVWGPWELEWLRGGTDAEGGREGERGKEGEGGGRERDAPARGVLRGPSPPVLETAPYLQRLPRSLPTRLSGFWAHHAPPSAPRHVFSRFDWTSSSTGRLRPTRL